MNPMNPKIVIEIIDNGKMSIMQATECATIYVSLIGMRLIHKEDEYYEILNKGNLYYVKDHAYKGIGLIELTISTDEFVGHTHTILTR